MATYVGSLEADLQAASEYATGGIGPFFQQSRREEPFELPEFLSRASAALRKLGIVSAITLFVDEADIYTADDETGDTLEAALNAAQAADLDGAVGFYLMLSYQDKEFSHIFSIEAYVDHPADEAALTVLDVATPLDEGAVMVDTTGDDEEIAEEDEEEDDDLDAEYEEPLAPADDDVSLDSDETTRNMDRIDLVESFLERVLAELNKELALVDPEIDVWIDWEGAYASSYGSALPGLAGL